MNKIFLFLAFFVFMIGLGYSQSAIDLSDLSDKKTENKKSHEKKGDKTKIEKSTDSSKAQKQLKSKINTTSKKAKTKKPIKKTGNKYKFEKKEEAVYKFDEKGNPVIPKAKVSKSTSIKNSNTDLSIGLEDREVNLKGKNK